MHDKKLNDSHVLRILCVGDVVGTLGQVMFQKHISDIRSHYAIDGVIVNGENSSAQGRGITPSIVKFLRANGADVITSGNHIWYKKEIYSYLQQYRDLLRPANFPSGAPGVGVTTFACKQEVVGVVNIQGRVFMRESVDDPFRTVESILTYLKDKTSTIIVDFHAETTSEKMAMGHFLDGKVSAVVGTHTHVQTADERILPGGTAFMTDLGMVGSLNGMLGMKKDPIVTSFLTQLPTQFVIDIVPPAVFCGVVITIDTKTGKAIGVTRVRVVDDAITVSDHSLE